MDYMIIEELKERLDWLRRLRWLAIVAGLLFAVAVRLTGLAEPSLMPPVLIASFAASYNILFFFFVKNLRTNAILQMYFDQLTLALLVYFSGGCDSPFIYFFIFHVLISAFILPGNTPFILATTGWLLPLIVMAAKHLGLLPHFGILKNEPLIFSDLKTMAIYGSAFILTLYLTAYFSNYLSLKLHKSRMALRNANTRLSSLLDASRLAHSTLELEEILSTSLKIILNTTNLKAGLILLTDESIEKRCYEFFDCNAYNCPAHRAEYNCWRLEGVMCHGGRETCPFGMDTYECYKINNLHTHHSPIKSEEERLYACSNCEYFISSILQPKMATGFKNGDHLRQSAKLDGDGLRKALMHGKAIVDYSRENPFQLPLEPETTLIIPLIVQKEILGVFYLVSDQKIVYTPENLDFFHLLSETLSSGIFNSRLYTELESSYLATILAISNAIEAKDPYTRGHSERVARLCLEIAEEMGLSEQEKEHLKFAAILHDVGKIGISRELLTKHCSLEECEAEEIKSHPLHGVKILEPIPFLRPVIPAIKHHHENYDGSGYPDGLRGSDIPFKARILKIADAWDAMRSDRPYRKALPIEEAEEELLRNSGTHFDPSIVDAFLKILDRKKGEI